MGESVWARLLPLAGLALGAIWQLVDRRDLTNRLTVAAVLVVLMGLLHAVFGGGYVHVPGVSAGLGLVAGLVLTEQWLRRANARQEQLGEPRAVRTAPE